MLVLLDVMLAYAQLVEVDGDSSLSGSRRPGPCFRAIRARREVDVAPPVMLHLSGFSVMARKTTQPQDKETSLGAAPGAHVVTLTNGAIPVP